MAEAPRVTLRIPAPLLTRIDAARGRADLSAWLRAAATQRLEAERGLGPDITATLADHATQLRGLGTNLNQLARHANEGRPVEVNDRLLTAIDGRLREVRALLGSVDRALRGE